MDFLEIYIYIVCVCVCVCVIVHKSKMGVQEPMYDQVIQVSI